jgi:hypothetical protein
MNILLGCPRNGKMLQVEILPGSEINAQITGSNFYRRGLR